MSQELMPYYIDGRSVSFAEWQAFMRRIELEDVDPHADNEFLSRGVPVDLARAQEAA